MSNAQIKLTLCRYKKLSKQTWGIWGEWSGTPQSGCETVCRDLGLDPEQWRMGKTKIFIRFPETVSELCRVVYVSAFLP